VYTLMDFLALRLVKLGESISQEAFMSGVELHWVMTYQGPWSAEKLPVECVAMCRCNACGGIVWLTHHTSKWGQKVISRVWGW
jgi:hypothetical protein